MRALGQGWPATVGKLGSSVISKMAEDAIEAAPKLGASITASIAIDGRVWIDRAHNVADRDAVVTFNSKSDPDWLADEIRFEARARGLL